MTMIKTKRKLDNEFQQYNNSSDNYNVPEITATTSSIPPSRYISITNLLKYNVQCPNLTLFLFVSLNYLFQQVFE
jgi:hypothetical protein